MSERLQSYRGYARKRLAEAERTFVIDRVAYDGHIFKNDIFPQDIEDEIQVNQHVLFGKYLGIRSLRKDLHLPPEEPDTREVMRSEVIIFERKAA